MIKCNVKDDTFIIFDGSRTIIYDSRIGFMDFKALSLKDGLDSNEADKLIAYIKPPLKRNTFRKDNYIFYLINFSLQKGSKVYYRMMIY